jgi:hypothetical protein
MIWLIKPLSKLLTLHNLQSTERNTNIRAYIRTHALKEQCGESEIVYVFMYM